MPRLPILPTLLLTLLAAPAAAQGIPDYIPDLPGESPADRAQERLIESHRGFLGRVFTLGSFDAAPLPGDALGYQSNLRLGLEFRNGDAVFLAMNARVLPAGDPPVGQGGPIWYAGLGYTMSGTRLLGSSEAAERSALSTEVGWWPGESSSLVALDVSPTYEVLRGAWWSLPVGARFSLAGIIGPDGAMLDPFVGLTAGVKLHVFARDRLELK